MSKKEDNIKVLIEKARRGDVKELLSLSRAFSRWLRSSFAEELSQPSVRRLIESFLHNLNKLVRKIEKIEDLYWKTKSVEMLSRLVETIYNTTDSGMSIKYIERIVPEIERVHEDQTGVKSLGDIIGLLGELPQKTTVESPSGNNRKLSPKRKKRAGCLKAGPPPPPPPQPPLPPPPPPPPPPKPPLPEEEKRKKKKKTTDSLRDTGKDKEMPQPVAQKGATGPLGGGESKAIAVKKKTKKKKKKTERESPVTFRAHWQHYTVPQSWTDLLIYLYSGLLGGEKADIDIEERIKELETLDLSTAGPVPLKQGTKILVKPEMPGFRFSPEECIVEWYEDFVPVTFGMVTELKGRLPKLGKKVDGQVNFFVGPLLIAEINLNVIVKKRLEGDEKFPKSRRASVPYQKIFASYAHEDSDIVEIIEEAYSAFGNEYMRDFVTLRSGEEWDPALLELIKKADVFHLFWSKASRKSDYVKKEWNEALKRRKKRFIRPAYWETPMPKPLPRELKKNNFKKIGKIVQRLIA